MSRIRVPSLLLECVMLQFFGCGEAHCSKTYCVVVVLEVVETSLPNSWWWDGQLWPYQESDNLSKYEERRLRLGSESDKVLLQWFWFSANWVLLLTGDMKHCQDVTVQVPCIMHIAKTISFVTVGSSIERASGWPLVCAQEFPRLRAVPTTTLPKSWNNYYATCQ